MQEVGVVSRTECHDVEAAKKGAGRLRSGTSLPPPHHVVGVVAVVGVVVIGDAKVGRVHAASERGA